VSRWQEQRVLARFERDADGVSRSVDLRLRAHLDSLDALHGVYVASHDVDRTEFRRAAEPWLRKLPSLKAMGWHERLPRSALPGFEAAVRAEGDASFRVFDRDPSLTPGDDELIAMRYVEPRAGNEAAVGVNALSIPASRQAVEAARRGRAAVATGPVPLTQEPGDQMGVVVYRAVRGPDDGALRGLVFVTLRMEDTLAALRAGSPDYLQVCLIDTGAPAGTRRLAGPPACDAAPSERTMLRQVDMPFAGRAWELRVEPRSGVPAESGPLASERGTALLFSITGLAATGMMGALLLIVTGRARRTEVAVNRAHAAARARDGRAAADRACAARERAALPHHLQCRAAGGGLHRAQGAHPAAQPGVLRPHRLQRIGAGRPLGARSLPPGGPAQDAALFEQLADGMIAEFSRSKRLLHKDGRRHAGAQPGQRAVRRAAPAVARRRRAGEHRRACAARGGRTGARVGRGVQSRQEQLPVAHEP
jgi:CHASE1-domain containing sensor protein